VHGDGPARYRAPLVPVEGPVSLRLRLGTSKWGTLEMDVEPAFVGRRSPGVDAPVLQASADAASVRVDWRVDATDEPIVVERAGRGGEFADVGEVQVAADGVAHFADAAVTPGHRYGYRLAGATAEVWVQVPVGLPPLSLAIAPNPAHGAVRVSLGVDRTAPIELALLDVQGRVLHHQVLGAPAPGEHVFDLGSPGSPGGPPPGLYFVRLERGGEVITRRVTLLR